MKADKVGKSVSSWDIDDGGYGAVGSSVRKGKLV